MRFKKVIMLAPGRICTADMVLAALCGNLAAAASKPSGFARDCYAYGEQAAILSNGNCMSSTNWPARGYGPKQ